MATWKDDVKQAVINLNGIANYRSIYEEVQHIRKKTLPPSWQAIIRRTIETSSSDSEVFDNNEDIYFSVNGIGQGVWGLRECAEKKNKIACDISEPSHDPTQRELTTTYRILRDTQKARELKLLYSDQCQLCRQTIQLKNNETYSEAHHIKPLGSPHNGPDSTDNLIIVCPNCHVKLDYGAIRLENSIFTNHHINNEFLNYHNKYIFKEE